MSQDVDFRLLGPWEVRANDSAVTIPSGRLRTLLTSLLLSANQPVGVDTLADQLWPEHQPSRVRGALHTYVGRLRKLLGAELIQTHPGGGYQLLIETDTVDVHRFRGLLSAAERTENRAEELALLREALELWRGKPFADMYSTWLDRDVVPRLTEEWFAATARRIDLELDTGQPERVIAELRDLTTRYPTRESLWYRLITALHKAGRRAEALDAYQRVRVTLSDEFGIDPGEQLIALQRAVLLDGSGIADEPAPEPPAAIGSLRQLPHDVTNFTGRQSELARLDALVGATDADGPDAPMIVSIDGAPGVGKTTLAVHWAHWLAHRKFDVQLYLNLRGYGPGDPMTPNAAAETLLRALGVGGGQIPSRLDERSALLRSTLAGRQVLILLDNARDSAQVRPLLPGTSSLVIVTSRNQLRGLSVRDGAHRVTLNRLSHRQSVRLLGTAVGPDRVASEPDAASRLAELCDHLPLALAIVAERAHRADALAEVVAALEDEVARLDMLDTGEDDPNADLRAALSWSYRALSADAAAMFRTLGLHPAGDIGVHTAAAMANVPMAAAQAALDQLVAAHLVEQRSPHRYEQHDLIRLYATEVAASRVDPSARAAIIRRMLDWYLHAALSADHCMTPLRNHDFADPYQPQTPPPVFTTVRQARSWFEREYHCLRAMSKWAAANGWAGHSWRLAIAMTTFFDSQVPWRDGQEFFTAALATAESTGELLGEGFTLNSLGCLCMDKGDWIAAIGHFERALPRFQQCAHLRGEGMALINLSLAYGEMGNATKAAEYATRAHDIAILRGDPRNVSQSMENHGIALTVAGEYAKAVELHLRSAAINQAAVDNVNESFNQQSLGRAYAGLGQTALAVRAFRTSIGLHRICGNRRWEAIVLTDLGGLLDGAGHPGLATMIWESALNTLNEFDDPKARTSTPCSPPNAVRMVAVPSRRSVSGPRPARQAGQED